MGLALPHGLGCGEGAGHPTAWFHPPRPPCLFRDPDPAGGLNPPHPTFLFSEVTTGPGFSEEATRWQRFSEEMKFSAKPQDEE